MLPRLLALGTLLAVFGRAAYAAPYTWTGGGTDNLWSDTQNWNGGQRPVAGTDAAVTFAGTANLQPSQDLAADFVLNSLTFANGGGAFVLGGGALDFRANAKPGAPSFTQDSFKNVVVNNALILTDKLAVAVTYDVNSATNAPSLALGGTISGAGSLTFSGNGSTVLSGANTYTGGTNFAGGTVTVGNAGALGSSGALTFLGGTLRFSAANQTDYLPRFSTTSGQKFSFDTNGQTVVLAGSLTAAGSAFAKFGLGTLTLTGSNAFPAGVTLGGGTLNVANAGALGTTGTLSFTGGTLQYSAANRTDYSARFSTADYQYASIDTDGQDVTFASGFASTHGGFTKLGQGKLTILGAITSGFATAVKEGTLEVPAGGSVTNSYVVVSGGATFNVSGGAVGASSSGFELGTTPGTATLNFSGGTLNNSEGDIGYTAGSLAIFNQTGGSSNSTMNVGSVKGSEGRYTLTDGTLTAQAFVGNSGTGTFTQNGGTVSGVLVAYNPGSQGTYVLNAGTVNGNVSVGVQGTGTFTQNGGTVTNGGPGVGNFAGAAGTYSLNGGTLATAGASGGSGTSTFNFNGGTVQATASRTNFFQTFTTANVQTGGAIIDTADYNVTAAQLLAHDTTAGAPTTDGGLTKKGAGVLTLTWANTYNGPTQINAGTVALSGSGTPGVTGPINVAAAGTLDVSALSGGYTLPAGRTLANLGTVNGNLTVAASGTFTGGGVLNGLLTVSTGGLVEIAGGTLTVSGGVINNGTIRLRHGASLTVGNGGTFTNNAGATLDLITGSAAAPAGFYNNGGTVLDGSVIKTRSVSLSSGTLAVTLDGYTGHTYGLQRSDSLAVPNYRSIGALQTGTTGQTLTFTDSAASGGTQGFYRVQIDP